MEQEALLVRGQVFSTLLDRSPADNETLLTVLAENSGIGRVTVFLSQTMAEFNALCRSPGDRLCLDGLETNLLRVASDFYQADFVCSYLDNAGTLTPTKQTELEEAAAVLLVNKRATIPSHLFDPLFCFMRYTLLGTFHLNKYATGINLNNPILPDASLSSIKRKLIVNRLSDGYSREKRRRFTLSRLNESLRNVNINTLVAEIGILESKAVVSCPTRRSVELSRRFGENTQKYLRLSCGFSQTEFERLTHVNTLLID